ncbi:helix-turn-helix transcriptional regulator [Methanobrevibacter sp.]|uniref:helix-turn-helix transcriptional regulator n=1 Tax=Methanobrevibacter sp. TaxID=66852 RepID=UPI0038647D7E
MKSYVETMFHSKTLYILTEGGIIIKSDYFDGINDLDDFNLLKFVVTSELRLKLLFSLYESSKTIKELESEFNRKPGNISRGLNELRSCKLIQKFPNKLYAVSSIGFLLAKNLEHLMYTLKSIDSNGEFLENHSIKTIPNKFLKELSIFNGSTVIKSTITEFAKPINVYLENIKNSTYICIILPVFSKIFMDAISEALINHDGYLDVITTKNIYDLVAKSDSDKIIKALVRDKKINFYIVDDLPNIFFTVSDVFASLFLFFDDVVFDNSEMLLLDDKSDLNDAYRFYRYFKEDILK